MIQRVLVAERRIKTRPVHAGRGTDLVERRAGVAAPPEPAVVKRVKVIYDRYRSLWHAFT
jgi:hypothetical protein